MSLLLLGVLSLSLMGRPVAADSAKTNVVVRVVNSSGSTASTTAAPMIPATSTFEVVSVPSSEPASPPLSPSLSSPSEAPSSTAAAHVPLPAEVRGIYLTGYTAASSRMDSLLAYVSSSHLNTVVIDLKLDDGVPTFALQTPSLKESSPLHPVIHDLDGLLVHLKDRGIYRIARIAVMRDKAFGEHHPELVLRTASGAVWHDSSGMVWLDPASPKVSDYDIALAQEAYARGFDEVQFDYVRFASDGALSTIRFPVYDGKEKKVDVMQKFFTKVGGTLNAAHIPVSFDLFGLTFWSEDGLGIGQRVSDVYPVANFVSPMVYPSHYANGFQGFANPANYPYEVVKRSLDKGVETLSPYVTSTDPIIERQKFRPWIQDFNLGATYDASKVKAQIKAARDAGASGWLIWNARNVYTKLDYSK